VRNATLKKTHFYHKMDNNLSVLVDAKNEYQEQLVRLIAPVMIEVFHAMFQEATTASKNRKVLQMFQKYLKEVPNWSNAMSKSHSDKIVNRCSWFNDLLAAVFVSNVKILSAVRIQSGTKKLSLKLPSNEVFVQTVYNNAAKDLYNDPYVFSEVQSEYRRDDELTQRFGRCIELTIKELIPVQDILSTYMHQASNQDEFDVDHHDPVDDDDVEGYTEDAEGGEGEGEGMVDEPPEGPNLDEYPDGAPPQPEEGETMPDEPQMSEESSGVPFETEVGVKTIPTHDTPGEEESLFDDAPEQRTKKLSYM